MEAVSIARALGGGVLIGGAASGLLLLDGRIAGISNIVAGLVVPRRGETAWRLSFVGGLLSGGALLSLVHRAAFPATHSPSLALTLVAGLLVGFGARVGSGCTSGHGVCGLARRSWRSLVATVTFMVTGAVTVYLVRHVLGAPLR